MKTLIINIIVIFIVVISIILIPSSEETLKRAADVVDKKSVVIDPGHGGMDGGAVGCDGTPEKNINLDIGLVLREYLERKNIYCIMTRDDDRGLYEDDAAGGIRSLKTEDMYKRKSIMDESKADLVVSIHLNSFSEDRSVKGAQVFYPDNESELIVEESKKLAETIQGRLNENINMDRDRTELGKDDVYIFKDARQPIVIIECGFLSNLEDLDNLKKTEYRKKLVKNIGEGICKYMDAQSVEIQ